MILFVVGPFFRRRRPRRARDEMPTEPLVEVLLFWVFFGIGALSGGVAIAAFAIGPPWAGVAGAIASAACLYGTFAMWRRLRR